jgi:hypothetical protein
MASPAPSTDPRAGLDAYRQSLLREIKPQGTIENEYFDRLVTHGWCARHFRATEVQMLSDFGPHSDDEAVEQRRRQFMRARRDHERTFDHALRQLSHLQTERATAPATGSLDVHTEGPVHIEAKTVDFRNKANSAPARPQPVDLAAAVSTNYHRQS